MRPPGIPASATIWAEVVDGLGRKVGAWFDGGDVPLVEMWDPDSGHPWSWAPDCESQWMGDFDERMTPSAAAQCRQLYEKGLAHLAAEATPKPTLIPVDLTELREAVEAFDRGRGAWTVDDLIEAARRLLSSGGAP